MNKLFTAWPNCFCVSKSPWKRVLAADWIGFAKLSMNPAMSVDPRLRGLVGCVLLYLDELRLKVLLRDEIPLAGLVQSHGLAIRLLLNVQELLLEVAVVVRGLPCPLALVELGELLIDLHAARRTCGSRSLTFRRPSGWKRRGERSRPSDLPCETSELDLLGGGLPLRARARRCSGHARLRRPPSQVLELGVALGSA
jgi:hypothetical protein